MCAICSLDQNWLCGVGFDSYSGRLLGKFTLDAINAICDALTKSNVQSIRCACVPSNMSYRIPAVLLLMARARTLDCSLAENQLTGDWFAPDMSAVIKLAEVFPKMPNLRKVK